MWSKTNYNFKCWAYSALILRLFSDQNIIYVQFLWFLFSTEMFSNFNSIWSKFDQNLIKAIFNPFNWYKLNFLSNNSVIKPFKAIPIQYIEKSMHYNNGYLFRWISLFKENIRKSNDWISTQTNQMRKYWILCENMSEKPKISSQSEHSFWLYCQQIVFHSELLVS